MPTAVAEEMLAGDMAEQLRMESLEVGAEDSKEDDKRIRIIFTGNVHSNLKFGLK
jgi:hypothetical protein